MRLSDRCANPNDNLFRVAVVDDQVGRLTFTDNMALAIMYLLGYRDGLLLPFEPAPYGTYNLTSSGTTASWAEIACRVFDLRNGNGNCIHPVSTEEYYSDQLGITAPRPTISTLSLKKARLFNLPVQDWEESLVLYMEGIAR